MMSGVIEDDRKKFKKQVKIMERTVKTRENNLKESNQNEKKLNISNQDDQVKYQGISKTMNKALKKDQQLLNNLHQRKNGPKTSRTNYQADLNTSYSTLNIVQLQYKYEDLLGSHHGLLKLLERKGEKIKKVHEENVYLKTEIKQLKQNLSESEEQFTNLRAKYTNTKAKKNEKIKKLKTHKETLQMVHDQLVNVLDNQCKEKDANMSEQIRNCRDSGSALLLQEIRKSNMLAYKNFQLNQKVEFLKSYLQVEKKRPK